ncbi:hypothetical protein NUW54_g4286 [Trametes sanguinea]|nr:hypothetical protein NUW54_g4286 [Trametes sanguinea]
MFSDEPLASNPHNHCIPIYDLLQSPINDNVAFLVMPFLRQYNNPRFDTVGEVIECMSQLLEGIQFLHKQHVAHRDIMFLNFMMDPTVKISTRTRHPVKYYIIDFGISRKYPADCISPREDPIWGGIKTVPEFHKSNEPCDPFPTDIYYTGYLLWDDFVEKSVNFEFLRPLVEDMMQEDPEKRPTIDEVVQRFHSLHDTLTTRKLRSRVVHKKDFFVAGFFRALRHTFRTAEYHSSTHIAEVISTLFLPSPVPPQLFSRSRSYEIRREVKVPRRQTSQSDPIPSTSDPICGGVKKVSEFHKSRDPRDPFPTDLLYVGYLLWEDFVEKCPSFEFMRPHVAGMMQEDLEKRPTMNEVVEAFD